MSRYSSTDTHSDISYIIDETSQLTNKHPKDSGGGNERPTRKYKKPSSKSNKFVKRPSYNSSDDDSACSSVSISIDQDYNNNNNNNEYASHDSKRRMRKLSTSSNISHFSSISENRAIEDFNNNHTCNYQTRAKIDNYHDKNSHSKKLLEIQEHLSSNNNYTNKSKSNSNSKHDSKQAIISTSNKNSTNKSVFPSSESRQNMKKFCSCDSDEEILILSNNNNTNKNNNNNNQQNKTSNAIISDKMNPSNFNKHHHYSSVSNEEDYQNLEEFQRKSSVNQVIQKLKHTFSKNHIQNSDFPSNTTAANCKNISDRTVTYQQIHPTEKVTRGYKTNTSDPNRPSFLSNIIKNLFLEDDSTDEELYELNSKNIMITDTLKTIIMIVTSLIVCITSIFLIIVAVSSIGVYESNTESITSANKNPKLLSHLLKTLTTIYKKIYNNFNIASRNLRQTKNSHFIGLESNQDIEDHMNVIFNGESVKNVRINSDIDSNNHQPLLEISKNLNTQYTDNHDSHFNFMNDFDFGSQEINSVDGDEDYHQKVVVPTVAPLDDQYVAPTSRAWFGDELSQEINNNRAKTSKKRLPKLLIVGAKKCGSTALKMFLSHHPKLKSPGEQNFFNKNQNYEQGFSSYLANFDYTFEDEISFDKTPEYFDKPNVPSRVKEMEDSELWQKTNPSTTTTTTDGSPTLKKNIKILAVVCNPIERALSQYNHIMHIQQNSKNKNSAYKKMNEIGNFPKVIEQSLDNVFWNVYDLEGHLAEMGHIRGQIENGQSDLSDSEEASSKNKINNDQDLEESDRIRNSLKHSKKYQNLSKKLLKAANLYLDETIKPRINMASPTPDFLISSGLYSLHLKSWYNSFPQNQNQIMVVNGQDLIEQPGQVIEEIEDFLNVEKFITSDNFIYDKKQGFYCIVTKENPKKFCVGDHSKHGSSRSIKDNKRSQRLVTFEGGSSDSGDSDISSPDEVSKETMDKLREKLLDLFMPFNLELEQMLGKEGFTKNWR